MKQACVALVGASLSPSCASNVEKKLMTQNYLSKIADCSIVARVTQSSSFNCLSVLPSLHAVFPAPARRAQKLCTFP